MRLLLFGLFLWGQLPLYGSTLPKDAPPIPEKEENYSIRERIKRIYWLDLGVGFPQLTSVELGIQALTRLQVGFSYGMIPGGGSGGGISPKYSLPSQNVILSNGLYVTVQDPSVTVSFSSLCPYLRYFPNSTGFYLQFTLGILKVHNVLGASLYDVNGNQIPGATASGTIDVTQYLPTLSMGHTFNSKLFFYSVNMGFTAIANLSFESKFDNNLPDAFGGSATNQAAMDQLNSKNAEAAAKASDEFKQLVSFLPSLQFAFGFFF